MPKNKQDEKRIKEIDEELDKIHKAINEYHSRTDEHGVTWQIPGKPHEYQELVNRELELLTERKSIVERANI